MLPLQPPEAVQPVALVEFHVRVEEPPLWIEVGEAVSVAVGALPPERTVMVLDFEALPSPRQYSLYVEVAEGETRCEPDKPLSPLHAPWPVHQRAFLTLQVSVA